MDQRGLYNEEAIQNVRNLHGEDHAFFQFSGKMLDKLNRFVGITDEDVLAQIEQLRKKKKKRSVIVAKKTLCDKDGVPESNSAFELRPEDNQ